MRYTLDDLITYVVEMRVAQREYFQTHTQSTLNRALACERRVDEWLKNYKKNAQPTERQMAFDGTDSSTV